MWILNLGFQGCLPVIFQKEEKTRPETFSEIPKDMETAKLESYLRCGRGALWETECQRIRALNDRINVKNPLYTDFRTDEMYFAYQKFVALGLTLKQLFDFQKKCPAVYPWNAEYDSLRFNVNKRFNIFPLIIVMAQTEKHVIRAFQFATKYHLTLTLRGGAHSFEGFSLGSGMIIDQSQRVGIRISRRRQEVQVEPGVLLGPLIEQLYQDKLAIPTGLCCNNCIAGYSLGGGIGLLTRKYGVTSDSLVEIKLLLADGRIVTANQDHYADLFWACRGGGGNNFGIALSFRFKVYPMDRVYVIRIEYAANQLRSVIEAWQNLTPTLPDDLTLDLRAVAASGLVSISGQYLGDDRAALDNWLLGFTCIPNTKVSIQSMKYLDAIKYFCGSGRWLPFFKMKTSFIESHLTPEALDVFDYYMSLGQSSFNISLKSMGGRNNEIAVDATAFPHRNVKGWFLIDAQWSDESQAEASMEWTSHFYDSLSPWLPKKVYVNSPDIDLPDYLEQYYGPNLERLIEIKSRYDPHNIFSYAQSIPVEA